MRITFLCQGCGGKILVPPGYARGKIQCPGCGVIAEIPEKVRKEAAALAETPLPSTDPSDIPAPAAAVAAGKPMRKDGPAKRRPPRRVSLAPPVVSDDPEDNLPYDVTEKQEFVCPECRLVLEDPNVSVCPRCSLDFAAGEKRESVYREVNERWTSGLPQPTRTTLFLFGEGWGVLMTIVGIVSTGGWETFLSTFVIYSGFLAFLLGTYFDVRLTRNGRGRCQLIKTWHICFIARPAIKLSTKDYWGVQSGHLDQGHFFDWIIVFALLMPVITPAIFAFDVVTTIVLLPAALPAALFYWFAIHKDLYFTGLTADHNRIEQQIYRGWSLEEAQRIEKRVRETTGLNYPS